MDAIRELANTTYREFVSEGIPASGKHEPKKAEIRRLFAITSDAIAGAEAGRVDASTWAGLAAVPGTRAGQPGRVVGPDAGTHTDPVVGGSADNEGEYAWSVSPAGWQRIGGLQQEIVLATNTGAGTADAVGANTDVRFDTSPGRALIAVNFIAANTGPMTLALNGETARPLVTNTGAPITAGYIQPEMAALVQIDRDGNYRLFSYGDAAAIEARVIALKADVEAVRDAVLGAASSFLPNIFATEAIAEAYEPDFIPAFLRTAGKSSADDGGGGLYADPSVDEPAIGPKIFLPSINRWFTGTETVMDIMRFGARRMGSGTSGVIADNDAALADAKEWLHGRLISSALPTLEFGPGVYDYSNFPNFARHRAQVIGRGDVKLRFHGSGTALSLIGEVVEDPGGGLSADGAWEMKFQGFQVEAPASAMGDVVLMRAVHESDIDIEVRGGGVGSGKGMILEWCVSSRIRYRCAANGFGWYDNARPEFGLWIDRYPVPITASIGQPPSQPQTSLCHIHADTTDTAYGIWCPHSNANMIRGTFQGHQDIGVGFLAGAVDNVMFNSDCEVNANIDIFITGAGNTIRDSVTLSSIVIGDSASGNRVVGGVHSGIVLGPSTKGNEVSAKIVSRLGTGNISDSGQGNAIRGSWDSINDRWWRRAKQAISIIPTGTIYTWTNTYGDPIVLSLVGGAIEGLLVNGEGVQPPSASGGQYIVTAGATVQWDASSAPTANVWGL